VLQQGHLNAAVCQLCTGRSCSCSADVLQAASVLLLLLLPLAICLLRASHSTAVLQAAITAATAPGLSGKLTACCAPDTAQLSSKLPAGCCCCYCCRWYVLHDAIALLVLLLLS
jgi:hypothetical protein